MSSSLKKLRQVLRKLGPSEQLLREARLVLSSQLEDYLSEAKKLEEERIAALEREFEILRRRERAKRKEERIVPRPPEPSGWKIRRSAKGRAPMPERERIVQPPIPPKVYIDTVVFLNVFKNEQPYAQSSERVLKGVEFGCLRGLSSDYSKVEISLILKKKELCEIAFNQIDRWNVKIVEVTDRVKLNLLVVRNSMRDINDLIHASTALTEHVDALMTRNIEDFAELQKYFLVWPPERVIEEFKVEECLTEKTRHAVSQTAS
jgi:predicted nucleic acid-binding protein